MRSRGARERSRVDPAAIWRDPGASRGVLGRPVRHPGTPKRPRHLTKGDPGGAQRPPKPPRDPRSLPTVSPRSARRPQWPAQGSKGRAKRPKDAQRRPKRYPKAASEVPREAPGDPKSAHRAPPRGRNLKNSRIGREWRRYHARLHAHSDVLEAPKS